MSSCPHHKPFRPLCYSPSPYLSAEELALATLSKSYNNQDQIDPDGLARVHGISSVAAEIALRALVKRGKAYRTSDGWYGPSDSFCKEIAERVAENERIEAENRRKYFSG